MIRSTILKERVDGSHQRASPTCIFNEKVQAANWVNDHRVVNDTWFVNSVQVFNSICAICGVIYASILTIVDIEAIDSVRVLAQATNATHEQYLGHWDLDARESAQWYRHFYLEQLNLLEVDIIAFNWVQCAELLIITTENKDDVVLEKCRTALWTGYMKLDLFIGLPSVILNIVDFTGSQLDFLDVFVASQRVYFRRTDANRREERFLLDHRGPMHNVPVDILQAVISHTTEKEPWANIWVLINCQRVQALTSSIDVQCSEVARKFATVLGD